MKLIKNLCLLAKDLYSILIYILSLILITPNTNGQGLNLQTLTPPSQSQNYSRMLSADQLEILWADAQSKGYDISTIPSYFQENGYSMNESLQFSNQIRVFEQAKYGFSNSMSGSFNSLSEDEEKLFGHAIFRTNRPIYDSNNLPTPENHILGVGDELSVIIYGETDASYYLKIDKEGKVSIPFLGPFSLQGLSIQSAKSLIKQKLSSIHSGLNGNEPTVFMDLSLTNVRTISISILGETYRPGSYVISSNSSLINALYKSQGPTINGSLRNVKVYRSNKLMYEADIYEYLTKGIAPNISLKDEDIVFIDTYKKRVELRGGIRKPGIYELKNENILELIELAGGYMPGADRNNVNLSRLNGPDQFVKPVKANLSSDSINDGDIIDIQLVNDFNIDKVKITGAINRPGFYNLSSNSDFNDLLISAGGYRDDALLTRIMIFQNKDVLKPSIKVHNAIEDDLSEINLNGISSVFVPSVLELTEPDYITIEGSVNRNGQIPYFQGMTVLDAIIFANGISDTALEGKIEVVRNKSLHNKEGFDFYSIDIPLNVEDIEKFELKARDKIFIRDNWLNSFDKTVTVLGEVEQPGNFIINPGVTKVDDIIRRTGNYPRTANLDGIKLYRVVQTVNDKENESKLERSNSIADFINDPRFEGSVSTLNGRNILQNLKNLESSSEKTNDSIIPSQGNRIEKLNGFELSKRYLINRENIEFLEIGLSYDEILSNENSQYNVTLLNGDILFIPPKANLVEIDGNVFSPTQAIFRKEKRFIDYIETAGGFKSKSDIKRSYIEYSNGDVKRVKSFLLFRKYPEVKTDSRIYVPQKPPGSTLNFDRVISLITSTISTYLLIQAVSTTN